MLWQVSASGLVLHAVDVSRAEPAPGTRRAVQSFAFAGTDGVQPPSPPVERFPARLEEWDGRTWVLIREARSKTEMDAFLAGASDQ